jgi:hypothetical protein
MKYTKYAEKYVHQRTNYAVYYSIDHEVQSMDKCRELSQPTFAVNALPRLWAVNLSTLELLTLRLQGAVGLTPPPFHQI